MTPTPQPKALSEQQLQTLRNLGNEAEQAADEIDSLRAEVERLRSDHAAALGLVSRIRWALGDNGLRMQDELVEWCSGLRKDAERIQSIDINGTFDDWWQKNRVTRVRSPAGFARNVWRSAIDSAREAKG